MTSGVNSKYSHLWDKENIGEEFVLAKNCLKWENGEVITILLDCEVWEICFWKNDEFIGCFSILKGVKYFPIFHRAIDGEDAAFFINVSGDPKSE